MDINKVNRIKEYKKYHKRRYDICKKTVIFKMLSVCIAIILFCNIHDIYASGKINCNITYEQGDTAGEIIIKVNVKNNPGTIMSETKFGYDDEVLEIKEMESQDLFAGGITKGVVSDWSAPNVEENPIKMIDGYLVIRGNTENTGLMYIIKAEVKSGVDKELEETTVSFSGTFLDWELNEYEIACDDTVININEIPAKKVGTESKASQHTMIIVLAVLLVIVCIVVIYFVINKKKSEQMGEQLEDISTKE